MSDIYFVVTELRPTSLILSMSWAVDLEVNSARAHIRILGCLGLGWGYILGVSESGLLFMSSK